MLLAPAPRRHAQLLLHDLDDTSKDNSESCDDGEDKCEELLIEPF